jgi:S-adenosylmethionine:tRNA ribosyltransferase-isomerase
MVELLFVRPLPPPAHPAPEPQARAAGERWRVLARPARGARPGLVLESAGGGVRLAVEATGPAGERDLRVVDGDLGAALRAEGEMPLPPYIERPPGPEDRERYQTVYARVDGAVAAPTAGLHLTHELLADLAGRGVASERLVLHVGPGTFRPLTSAEPRDHRMDEEWYELEASAAARLVAARAAAGRIVAVGTTSVRALESACDANGGALGPARGWTRKYILPPYRFQAVDVLLTNFHLPRTTLLLLVAAFAGEGLLRRAYEHAIAEHYRFYSYGDAMLVV